MAHFTSLISYMAQSAEGVPSQDATFDLLTKGLKELKTYVRVASEDNIYKQVFTSRDDLLVHGILHAKLLYLMDGCKNIGQVIGMLKAYNKSLYSWQSRLPANMQTSEVIHQFHRYLSSIVQYIWDKGYRRDEAIETSVITGCSIIAPYMGTLKKPFVGEHVVFEGDTSIENLKNEVIANLRSLWLTDSFIDTLLQHADDINSFAEDKKDFASALQALHIMSGNNTYGPLVNYMGWCYLYANVEMLEDHNIQKILAFLNNTKDISFKELYEAFLELTPASEGALLNELETYDALSKYMKNPDEYLDTDTNPDPLSLFDLIPLMNYIYTNRRFRSNDYVRSRFMKMENVATYFIYKGFFFIVPQTSKGENVDYLYVPVIDDLNGSQAAIIKYWRNGAIDILTENEYDQEIGNIT